MSTQDLAILDWGSVEVLSLVRSANSDLGTAHDEAADEQLTTDGHLSGLYHGAAIIMHAGPATSAERKAYGRLRAVLIKLSS